MRTKLSLVIVLLAAPRTREEPARYGGFVCGLAAHAREPGGLPPAVSAADDEEGWRMALARLADLVEAT